MKNFIKSSIQLFSKSSSSNNYIQTCLMYPRHSGLASLYLEVLPAHTLVQSSSRFVVLSYYLDVTTQSELGLRQLKLYVWAISLMVQTLELFSLYFTQSFLERDQTIEIQLPIARIVSVLNLAVTLEFSLVMSS